MDTNNISSSSIGTQLGTMKIAEDNLSEKTEEEIQEILRKQDSRKVTAFEASKLEKEAKKNWDIFYKRNETRFFKDRHWTLREFEEILDHSTESEYNKNESLEKLNVAKLSSSVLLEVGCGCGNFVFPLAEEVPQLKIFACDFSPRAVDFVRSHENYSKSKITAFVCDITEEDCFQDQERLIQTKADFVSIIFVMSSISPSKYAQVIKNLHRVMKPGGLVFFRDYGRYDMAQLRFQGGKKIDENFYARRDGTRSYFYTPEEVDSLFLTDGRFTKLQCQYVQRRTVNKKENVDVGRIFVQGKFIKC